MLLIGCKSNENSFSLCGLGIVKPYYYTGLKYSGEIYQIEKEFRDNYIPVLKNASGIAKIRFNVNCKGEAGQFEYEEYDMNYIKSNLNDSIETQVKTIVVGLNDWIPGTDDDGNPVNSHSFLSLRIINGEITEILPK